MNCCDCNKAVDTLALNDSGDQICHECKKERRKTIGKIADLLSDFPTVDWEMTH